MILLILSTKIFCLNIMHSIGNIFLIFKEHHLQRAICTGLIIPTPEVYNGSDSNFYNQIYPADYKMPRQLIHMQRKIITILFIILHREQSF